MCVSEKQKRERISGLCIIDKTMKQNVKALGCGERERGEKERKDSLLDTV